MSEEPEVDPIAAIEHLVEKLEALGDEETKAQARELVRGILALHGRGLTRLLEIARRFGDTGAALIEELARDPAVSPLLVLHDLHPDDMEARVLSAIERLGAAYPDLAFEDLAAGHLRVRLGARGGAPAASARVIETSLLEAVPDLTGVTVAVSAEAPLVQIRRKEAAP